MAHLRSFLAAVLLATCPPLVATNVAAQPAEVGANVEAVGLPELLTVAVQQSPALAAARIDVEVAEGQVLRSLGTEDPLLQASGSYFRQSDKSVAGDIIGTDFASSQSGQVSLSKILSTGGTVGMQLESGRQERAFAVGNTTSVGYTSKLSLSVQQPLLRGRGKAITRSEREQAKRKRNARQLDLDAKARDEVQKLIDAYWELVWARKELEIRTSALALAKKRRGLTQAAIALGSSAATALLEVEQVIATSEEEILLAEQQVTERSLELRRLAGLPIAPGKLDLAPKDELKVAPRTFALDSIVKKALSVSPELASLQEQGKGASIAVEVADNGLLPRLDLSLEGGPLGTDSDLASSVGNLATAKGYFVSGGLRYEQRIGKHGATGSKREAHARWRLVQVTERDVRTQIAVAASRAVQSARVAQKRMELSRRAIDLSEKNIEAERRRFEVGRATNFDVLERQEEQKQARLRYARAAVDSLRWSAAIDALTGELLPKYGIQME